MKTKSKTLSGQIVNDGFPLRFHVEGEGVETLILGSSLFYPRTFSENLRKHLRMGFIDYRAFAPTNKSFIKADYQLRKICDDIEDLRKSCGFRKSIVIGHSAHGYLALEYARLFPQSVEKVILIATGPSHGQPMMEAFQRWDSTVAPERKTQFAQDQERFPLSAAKPGRRFVSYCHALNAKSWFNPQFDSTFLWQDVEVNDDAIDYLYGEVFRDYNSHQAIHEISSPILLTCGLHDYGVAPFWTWNQIRETSPKFRVIVFEKSGHYPQLEESQDFDMTIINWIKEDERCLT